MPKGYWIVRVDITDMERYKTYVAANAGPLGQFGARFLVRAGRFENAEGSEPVTQCGDRIPELPGGGRLLALAGVPGSAQAAYTGVDGRSRDHRGLRRTAARWLTSHPATNGAPA